MDDIRPSHRMFGFKVTPMMGDEIIDVIGKAIDGGKKWTIASLNMHGMYVYLKDRFFHALHESDGTFVHIDGTPLIWLSKLRGLPVRYEHRTGVVDWLMPLLERSRKDDWRVFYLGSTDYACAEAVRRLRRDMPGVALDGRSGYFDATFGSDENRAVIDEINAYKPNILIVGMGMGRQERWIVENFDDLQVNCVITAGACMEYIAGTLALAPRWMGPVGLEWLYRLASSPRRVAWRYLGEPWIILWILLRNRLFGTAITRN